MVKEDKLLYDTIEKWLDDILQQSIPDDVLALNFNMYDDGDYSWSIELVGTDSFDIDDDDWRCDEVFDFGTRDNPLEWKEENTWDYILDEMIDIINRYLEEGQFADVLKQYKAVGIGFVDGDANTLYVQE